MDNKLHDALVVSADKMSLLIAINDLLKEITVLRFEETISAEECMKYNELLFALFAAIKLSISKEIADTRVD